VGVLLAGGALLRPSTIAAQQPTEEELTSRIDALMPAYLEAREAWNAYLQAQNAAEVALATPADTVLVGPIRIVTMPDQSETAAALFEEVWREEFGAVEESPTLREYTFAFQWRARLRDFTVFTRRQDRQDGQEWIVRVDISRIRTPTREQAKETVRAAIARVLSQDLPPGSPIRSTARPMPYRNDATVYRLLAVTPSGATRACLGGDTGGCLAALGMGLGDAAAELPAWFAPEQRQAMVEQVDEFQRGRDGVGGWTPRLDRDDPLARRCVEADDFGACDEVLASLDWVSSVPTSPDIRSHLFWYAVLTGGEGAWVRVLERAESPTPELLEHVSELPLEELVGRWRAHLVESRPDAHAGLGATNLTVLLWALICAALAMRSTRWRLA
jgi:hypothetical protein